MIFDLDDSVQVYEPVIGNNREAPEAERVRIHFRMLTALTEGRAMRQARNALGRTGEEDPTLWLDTYLKECFSERIVKIENLNIRKASGDIVPLTDPRKLYDGEGVLHEIAAEVIEAIRLREDLSKKKLNSASLSGSTDSQTTKKTPSPRTKKSSLAKKAELSK